MPFMFQCKEFEMMNTDVLNIHNQQTLPKHRTLAWALYKTVQQIPLQHFMPKSALVDRSIISDKSR